MHKKAWGRLQQLAELSLIVLILVISYPVGKPWFYILCIAVIALYFYTMWNAFKDGYYVGHERGYMQAESDRVY